MDSPSIKMKKGSECSSVLYPPCRAGNDVVDVRSLEAIEGGGCCHSVGAHVLKYQPIAHLQVRQATLLNNTIQAITCWAPNTAGVEDLIWLWLLLVVKGEREAVISVSALNHY